MTLLTTRAFFLDKANNRSHSKCVLGTEDGSGHVLVVEDEESIARAWGRLLRRSGYEVTLTANADRALAVVGHENIDLVLTDLHLHGMDGMDGIELMRRLRVDNDRLPIVVVTGDGDVGTIMQTIEQGVHRYLIKPVDPRELLNVVSAAVAERRERPSAILELQMRERFERAMDGLFVVYQPIVSWSGRHVVAYETLVRSNDHEVNHPAALLDLARRLGELPRLSEAIRNAAIGPMRTRREQLFLNIEPSDLVDPLLTSAPLADIANRVVLEVTERAPLGEVDNLSDRLAALRDFGYRIAVDDLGSGYSSLNSVALLEPDIAKLDMGLVRNVHLDRTKQTVVKMVVGMCKEMHCPLVVEGVETVDERDVLLDLGCDLFQGYLFARPANPFPTVSWG